MGITANCGKFLSYAKQRGASYSRTIMLGRQQLFIDAAEAEELKSKWNTKPVNFQAGDYAESFFQMLDGGLIDSIDHSDFEGATIIHDLNTPVPATLKSKYSVVFDGGTLEHVFNFPQAIKSCMDMLQVGGHFISVTPTNNYCGHGFYQFSPELFFSLFREQHGFKIKVIVLVAEDRQKGHLNWFQVKDPAEVKGRVTLSNSYPTSLMVLAEKIKETDNIQLSPFQSDYEHIWTVYDSIQEDKAIAGEHKWLHYYRKLTPEFVKRIVRWIVNRDMNNVGTVGGLGLVNPKFFTKMDI